MKHKEYRTFEELKQAWGLKLVKRDPVDDESISILKQALKAAISPIAYMMVEDLWDEINFMEEEFGLIGSIVSTFNDQDALAMIPDGMLVVICDFRLCVDYDEDLHVAALEELANR